MWLKIAQFFNEKFIAFLKWRIRHVSDQRFILILSVFLGIEIGVIVVALKSFVYFIKEFFEGDLFQGVDRFIIVILPIIGISLSVLVIKIFAKGKLEKGIPYVLYSIGRNSSFIKKINRFIQAITGGLTVGFGGSVGLEGPVVVTGSAWGSYYGSFFHLNSRHTTILIGCGSAAAISAIFNAPVAGVIFVLEVIIANLNIVFIIPLLISAVVGTMVSQLLMGEEVLFHFTEIDPVKNRELLFFILLGVICGFLSIYFMKMIYLVENQIGKIKQKKQRLLIGGGILGVLILFFPILYGEGYYALAKIIRGDAYGLTDGTFFGFSYGNDWILLGFLLASMLLKVFATGLTRAAGGIGGVFAPSMFMGGLAGFIFARALNLLFPDLLLSETNFTLVGMAGVSSGILHSPLTKIFLIAEITRGYDLLVPLMLLSAISFAIKIYFESHSFYTKQLALKGDYIIHDKDKTVLQDIRMNAVIERDFVTVKEDGMLGDLVEAVARSTRNIFPVVGEERELKGIILLNDVRKLIFKSELYQEKQIKLLMSKPPAIIDISDSMEVVMDKFDKTNAWNLPVAKNGRYEGFLSKSKIFSIYRSQLRKQTRELG
ncbi:chloride channel protein [Flexithrix dorotheae]|uniref:chloride channel protein n=1 Tax=Flexithrix dorotheae TaxID=70993 RepID=UPI0003698AFA|nr:chloride channel protein [Flexithrix dorotheae]